MNLRTFSVMAVLLMEPLGAIAADDPYTGFIKRVQQELSALGFDAGPVNGDFGARTQAALAQFQLSRVIPASGQLDDQTLAELGVKRDDAEASAGAGASSDAPGQKPESEAGEKPAS